MTAAWSMYGYGKMLLPSYLFFLLLFEIGRVDQKQMIIPDSLSFAVLLCAMMRLASGSGGNMADFLLGGSCVSVPMLLLVWRRKNSFGGGDIKLCFAGGCFLGVQFMLAGWFLALVFGSSYGIWQLLRKKIKVRQKIPFAPFLCLGMSLSLLCGKMLVKSYMKLFF